ncbi:Carbamoyl-phosphate synthase small chain [Desulfococcus multivorans DSM 2059]|uniref:Carbamoyl phosphate synthase small chain n=2 Tax=Desulfococcus multivorans TaxID=897 RepID=S7UNZ3_DESML|nr:glutamine-hydrolyzing carbamoyl-phosphate synthase small subunit [Desulfococcus multivorans]AOY57331.1 CarA: carbamoyl-phosphate synthase, small subunit [Desulfococcus multivorans]EPR35709.1 Carbamoyl-phosphate synthase small chain [Desulfococcus multivorans DSM 2059]SKA22207.1 carbamoyl-phosphate synthase small subunit [Desulfococcus multivorans DSM 2059]
MKMDALIALEDGRTFPCASFTGPGETWGELVFNTGMTGYQEILTDPSYRGQIVTMTYPLIGNYGVNPEDVESDRIQVAGFIVREYQAFPSNFRATDTLADYLKSQGIMGIDDLDTRALTRHIRNAGAMRAVISTRDLDPASLVRRARETPSLVGRDLVREVSTRIPYRWVAGERVPIGEDTALDATLWREKGTKFSVVAFDFGIKYNILRCLAAAGFEIVVVPASTGAAAVRAMAPDGIFLSNGPGDPEPVTYAVETIRSLLGYRPLFGICLGQQLLGLALGGRTYKLKFGHRGANQPVKNLDTGRIEITSQNHGFSVDMASLSADEIEVSHVNLNDQTLEGFRHRSYPAFSVQYHPEASPGPHDSRYLFETFSKMMAAA